MVPVWDLAYNLWGGGGVYGDGANSEFGKLLGLKETHLFILSML